MSSNLNPNTSSHVSLPPAELMPESCQEQVQAFHDINTKIAGVQDRLSAWSAPEKQEEARALDSKTASESALAGKPFTPNEWTDALQKDVKAAEAEIAALESARDQLWFSELWPALRAAGDEAEQAALAAFDSAADNFRAIVSKERLRSERAKYIRATRIKHMWRDLRHGRPPSYQHDPNTGSTRIDDNNWITPDDFDVNVRHLDTEVNRIAESLHSDVTVRISNEEPT